MRRLDAGTVRLLDGALVFWVVLWLVVGAWAGYLIWQLTALSASTVESGRSLGVAADALTNLRSVPVVGDASKDFGRRIAATAAQVVDAGQQADRSIRGLAVLIGLSVALGPSAPVLLFYLPTRLRWRCERREVQEALQRENGLDGLQAVLAGRAVGSLSLERLLARSSDPQRDLAEGRHRDLAEAELERLGLRAPW
jgi:hypothetical protein